MLRAVKGCLGWGAQGCEGMLRVAKGVLRAATGCLVL